MINLNSSQIASPVPFPTWRFERKRGRIIQVQDRGTLWRVSVWVDLHETDIAYADTKDAASDIASMMLGEPIRDRVGFTQSRDQLPANFGKGYQRKPRHVKKVKARA